MKIPQRQFLANNTPTDRDRLINRLRWPSISTVRVVEVSDFRRNLKEHVTRSSRIHGSTEFVAEANRTRLPGQHNRDEGERLTITQQDSNATSLGPRQRGEIYHWDQDKETVYVTVHKNDAYGTFTFKGANPPSRVIAMLSDTPTPIVIFDQTIITCQLWDHIISTCFEVRNFHKCMIVGASFSKIERDEYKRLLSLTHTLVTQFVHSWYDLYALRINHTFKFSKSLGVYHKGKKIQLLSYVLVVMNEDTKVLRAEIVPSVGHKDTIPVLKSIIKTPGKKMATQARFLFTDNVANDGPAEENLFCFLLK
ncbi:hypothetical protein PROFUN_16534 [Planoprotostelium fungivorum]|uniref:Uncharacterized protein n=1 Tax=Planoprotostelium fungivorum TaxID=1890364 RepID=A0A2P6MPJ6_9EUKA|nr:hypothetical protein PROFUN_16534 [Planoprotostelium fungivorum]